MIKKIKKIQGLRTIEEIAKILELKKQSAINLISKLKKQGYVTKTGGGQQKRIYKITTYKQTQSKGMFDIINKYSKLKVVPLFKHITHGQYTVENALIDAIRLKNKRVILAALSLFKQIKDWKKLSKLVRKYNVAAQLGCLYDIARTTIKTRKIPENIHKSLKRNIQKKTILLTEDSGLLNKEWNCKIPFSKEDLQRLK